MSQRTIPQIRERLIELAREHNLPELEELALETKRRVAVRRAPKRSRELTEQMIDEIKGYAGLHPELSLTAIAAFFNVNQGRVSEALYGKRG